MGELLLHHSRAATCSCQPPAEAAGGQHLLQGVNPFQQCLQRAQLVYARQHQRLDELRQGPGQL